MSHRTCSQFLLAGGLAVAVFLCAAASANALCTEILDPSCPLACAACCPGPCLCVPPGPWGYCQRQWRPWPGGDRFRQSITFPQSLGVELVATPRGTPPTVLPKEVYGPLRRKADMDPKPAPDIQIRQGAPAVPLGMPVPFEIGPGTVDGPKDNG